MKPAGAPTDLPILSVSDLTGLVKEIVETGFPSVWVTGEISNLARPASGHLYFTLKDAKTQLKSVIYRGIALRLKFDLRDGQEIFVRGRVSVYEPRGEYQLIVEEAHPKGVGAVELALRQLKEKLQGLGYFDPRRKRRLPSFPKQVALITSPTGAAVRDMVELLAQRWPAATVIVRPTRVQGEGAASDIALALRQLSAWHAAGVLPLDAVILGRGGGSTEDLWAFNEEVVAHAIFRATMPVISAVGHEIDVTVADLVADYRAETPSAAVVKLTPDRRELLHGLTQAQGRLRTSLVRRLDLSRQRLAAVAERRALQMPLERIRAYERWLDERAERLRKAMQQRLRLAQQRLAGVAERLHSLSPLNILARGYSLTRTPTGSVVRRADDVRPGDVVRTELAHGALLSRVEAIILQEPL
jgi:exodeoxyribonuclease VII large subunit